MRSDSDKHICKVSCWSVYKCRRSYVNKEPTFRGGRRSVGGLRKAEYYVLSLFVGKAGENNDPPTSGMGSKDHEETFHLQPTKMTPVKILFRLRKCAGWSVSSLDAHFRRYLFWCCGKYMCDTSTWYSNKIIFAIVVNFCLNQAHPLISLLVRYMQKKGICLACPLVETVSTYSKYLQSYWGLNFLLICISLILIKN